MELLLLLLDLRLAAIGAGGALGGDDRVHRGVELGGDEGLRIEAVLGPAAPLVNDDAAVGRHGQEDLVLHAPARAEHAGHVVGLGVVDALDLGVETARIHYVGVTLEEVSVLQAHFACAAADAEEPGKRGRIHA